MPQNARHLSRERCTSQAAHRAQTIVSACGQGVQKQKQSAQRLQQPGRTQTAKQPREGRAHHVRSWRGTARRCAGPFSARAGGGAAVSLCDWGWHRPSHACDHAAASAGGERDYKIQKPINRPFFSLRNWVQLWYDCVPEYIPFVMERPTSESP